MAKETITTEIVQMTPEMATEILKSNRSNRYVRDPQVKFHVNNIENGLWRLTHQGVAIDSNGELLDGQHRLKAIELSGKTVPIMVSRGMDPALMEVIDTGARRSPGDVFTIAGVPNASVIAAMVRAVMNYRQDRWTNEVVPHSTLLEYYQADPEQFQLAVEIARGEHNQVGMPPSLLAGVVYMTLASTLDEDKVHEWLPQVVHGLNLRPNDVAYILRRQYNNMRNDQRRVSPRTRMGLYGKAFTIWALDQRIPQYLRFLDSDPLPSIEQPGTKISNQFRR